MTTRNARNRCAGERDAREQLSNEHAIAVAVETVSRLDGVAIGAKNIFAAGERGNQSNQAGLRQMKVGEHLRDDADRFAGIEKDLGVGFSGAKHRSRPGGFLGGIFERSDDGRSDGENRAALLLAAGDCFDRRFGDFVTLGVNLVIFDTLGSNGLERSQANVERDFGNLDTTRPHAGKYFVGEVQSGGWRGNGAALFGENGLIAFAVGGIACSLDIGRQRNVAQTIERLMKAGGRMKAKHAQSETAALFDARFQFSVAKNEFFADGNLSSGPDQSFPDFGIDLANQENFYFAG